MRYTLLDMTTEGQDLKLSPSKFETGRNFANKMWNAGRFLLLNLSERPRTNRALAGRQLDFPARWVLERLARATRDCTEALERYRFSEYANAGYRFFRDDLCDWYIEWAKNALRAAKAEGAGAAGRAQAADDVLAVLHHCFERALRLLHPGMPFITEHLWQILQSVEGASEWSRFLMLQEWPEAAPGQDGGELVDSMERLRRVVTAARNLRNAQQLPDSTRLEAIIVGPASYREIEGDAVKRAFVIDRAGLSALRYANTAPQGQHLSEVLKARNSCSTCRRWRAPPSTGPSSARPRPSCSSRSARAPRPSRAAARQRRSTSARRRPSRWRRRARCSRSRSSRSGTWSACSRRCSGRGDATAHASNRRHGAGNCGRHFRPSYFINNCLD